MFWQLVVAACVAWWWSRRRLYRLASELPSDFKSYPIIGNAYICIGTCEDRMIAIQKIGRATNLKGGLSSLWLCHKLFISITDPTAIEVVAKRCLDKDEFTTKFTRTVIGNASGFAPVDIWRPRRKIMSPFFSLQNLNAIVPVFNQKSATMVEHMQAEVGAGNFSVWKYFTTYTFDSVCETAMGVEINSQENADHPYLLSAINELTKMLSDRMCQPWLHPDFVYKIIPVYKQFQHHLRSVISYVDKIIQVKRKELATVEPNVNKYNDNNDFKKLVEVMIKSFENIEAREETMAMVTAATDTTSVAVSFAVVLLSRYPAVQERLCEELQEVFGDSERAVTTDDLPQLQYLEAIIKETMRLYPPAPVVVREVHEDVMLPSGITLVNGTSIMINIWGAHRNPSYWGADAEQFRPERFLQGSLPHPAMFIPFSYSLRGCPGSRYAMFSAKTMLANLVRRYRLLPPAGVRAADLTLPLPVSFTLMMKAAKDFIVRIEQRN